MKPPMIELTIGNMFKNTPGFLSTLTLTVEDGSTWEIDKGLQLPKHITCGCSFTYIGKYLPNSVGKHFELNWLSDTGGTGAGTMLNAFEYPKRGGIADGYGPLEGKIFPKDIIPTKPAVPYTPDPVEPEELTLDDL